MKLPNRLAPWRMVDLYVGIRPNLSLRGSLRFAFWTWWLNGRGR